MPDIVSNAFGEKEKAVVDACDFDSQKQHQAISHIKLQDLGSMSKRWSTDTASHLPITSTLPSQELATKTSGNPAQQDSKDSQRSIDHETSMLEERLALQPVSLATKAVASWASTNAEEIWYGSQVQGLIDNNRDQTPENANELTLMGCSSIHSLEDDSNKQNTQAITKSNSQVQDGELFMYHHERHSEQEELSVSSCAKLERNEATVAGDLAPSRFLIADIGNQLQDQDKILVKRKRAELGTSPSKEKLRILNNIYDAINQWENTLWAYECEQAWNPGLVFSTIEAARGGGEEVKELLKSKDSGSRLLICCEAICELMHAFPPESLLPAEFVKECLLATTRPDIHEWVRRKELTTYQDVEASLFWDSLTRHAMYLVTHELATAKQIASIFTGILLPASRLKDSSKGEYESARLNLHVFIAILLGAKDAVAGAVSLKVKGCISNGEGYKSNGEDFISNGEDCLTQITLYKDNGGLERQERDGSASSLIVEVPTSGGFQTEDEVSSPCAEPLPSEPSCLSCSMLVKCLPWKKSRGKNG